MSNVMLYSGENLDPSKCQAGVYRQLTSFRGSWGQCTRPKKDGMFCGTHAKADSYNPPAKSTVFSARGLLHEALVSGMLPTEISKKIETELKRRT